MSLAIIVQAESFSDVYCTLQQQTATGSAGDRWDHTNGAWANSVPLADRKIPLTQGVAPETESFVGGTGKLGTYTGVAILRAHDANQSDRLLQQQQIVLVNGIFVFPATTDTISNLAADVYNYAEAQGGITSSNMRGTDAAFLAASWIAPDNAGIATASSEATAAKTNSSNAYTQALAAAASAASADGKLPADAATKINRLDATISSRSTHDAADVRSEINNNGGVIASNMRGTDAAFLAASWIAPDNASASAAAAASVDAKAASESVDAKITSTRAGYLDNLSAGPVATQSSVSAISNTTRSKLIGAGEIQIPDSGSTPVLLTLVLFDAEGNLEAPDGSPTFTAKNASGTDRSGNLGAATNPSTGQYEITYTVSAAHAEEAITVKAAWNESGQPMVDFVTFIVSPAVSGGGFTSSDRTNLNAIYNKLPSKLYLTGTAASDGDINLDELTGDVSRFHADLTLVAKTAEVSALQAHGDLTWSTAVGFLTSVDARLNNLDATISSRSTYQPGAALATSAEIAALEAHGDLTWSTATGFALASDPRLDHLDADITSRSTFDELTDTVTLTPGHGLALEAKQNAIQAKTDLIPANPAAVADIPSAGTIAAATDAAVTASHGAGSYTAGGGDATSAKQDTILAQIAALTPTPVSAKTVAKSRTWNLQSSGDGASAQNIITIPSSASVTLAMEFAGELNEDSSITLVTDVSVIEGDALTFTNLVASGDRTAAHFDVSGATSGLRRVRVTVTTSDGQTIPGFGFIEVI